MSKDSIRKIYQLSLEMSPHHIQKLVDASTVEYDKSGMCMYLREPRIPYETPPKKMSLLDKLKSKLNRLKARSAYDHRHHL